MLVETLTTMMNPGKGKGKGKGKPNAPGTSLKPGEWLCKNHICDWAIKRRPNRPEAKRCGNTKCCLNKSAAMNPPLDQRVPPQEPSYSIKTAQAWATEAATKEKSAAVAKKKKEAAKAGEAVAPGAVAETTATWFAGAAADLRAPAKASCKPLQFTDLQKEEFHELLPSLGKLVETLAADVLPPPLDLPTPLETANK